MAESPQKCCQQKCENPATHRYTWPGKEESFTCSLKVANIACAIGLSLQIIPISAYLASDIPSKA